MMLSGMCDARERCRLRAGCWVVLLAILTACGSASSNGGTGGAREAGTGGAGPRVDAGATGGFAGSMAAGGTAGASALGGQGGYFAPDSPCRSQADCGYGPDEVHLLCFAPGESPGCGGCNQVTSNCDYDASCPPDVTGAGNHQICGPAPASLCACQPVMRCQAGCRSDGDCLTGQACDASNHCYTTCVPGSCPVNFTCGPNNSCTRASCQTDADCAGVCVNGGCYESTGACRALAL